jgi:hypothetical protein
MTTTVPGSAFTFLEDATSNGSARSAPPMICRVFTFARPLASIATPPAGALNLPAGRVVLGVKPNTPSFGLPRMPKVPEA